VVGEEAAEPRPHGHAAAGDDPAGARALVLLLAGPLSWAITTIVTLISPPAPRPCTAREAISQPIDGAAPHSAEPVRKAPSAPRKTRLAPSTSQSLP
jgi:hypothetical protein